MSRTLSEMRAGGGASLPERTKTICLAQAPVAEAQSLQAEREALVEAQPADESDAEENPSRKITTKAKAKPKEDPRLAEIDARLDELEQTMRADTGELRLRATTAGTWRRWADENPARKDSPVDERIGYGLVNSTALLDSLGDYMASWDGQPMTDDDRAFVVENAAPGDLSELCQVVVQMHEVGGIRPKASPKPSSSKSTSENA